MKLDQFRFLFDADYRDVLLGLAVERGLPIVLGIGIIIVGIVFVLSGTRTAQIISETAVGAVKTVATKGKA